MQLDIAPIRFAVTFERLDALFSKFCDLGECAIAQLQKACVARVARSIASALAQENLMRAALDSLRKFYPIVVRVVFKTQPRAERTHEPPPALLFFENESDRVLVSEKSKHSLIIALVIQIEIFQLRSLGPFWIVTVSFIVVINGRHTGAQEQSAKDFAPDRHVFALE